MLKQKNQEFLSPFSVAYWKVSAKEFTNLRTLAICAILIAARVALKSVRIPIGDNLNIYVGFLVNSVSGAICGPLLSLASGAICDILGIIIAPQGPFMPLFTVIEMFCAFCFSICLYKTKITVGKLALSKGLVNVLGNIVFTSFAMTLYYEKGILAYLLPRVVKNILMLPIEIMLLVLVFNALIPMLTRMKLISSPQNKMEFNPIRLVVVIAVTALVFALTWFFYDDLKVFLSSLLNI